MRKGIEIELSAADHTRRQAIVADHGSAQKRIWRARIVLATADGCGTAKVMRRADVSKPCVWRWQARFMTAGVDGLLRDRTRRSRIPPLPKSVIGRVVPRRLGEPPPDGASHWTTPALVANQRAQRQLGAARGAPGRPRGSPLGASRGRALDAGDPRPLARRFGLVGEIALVDLDTALGHHPDKRRVESHPTMGKLDHHGSHVIPQR
jgi:transposase